jgi:acyl-coenzyme A thioesterase PaaI-like protein
MTPLHDPAAAPAGPGADASAPDRPRAFPAGIAFGFEMSDDDLMMTGDATLTEFLRSPGAALPRPSVLATIADCVAGIPAHRVTAPRLSVTLDIAVRMVAESCGDHLDIRGEIAKKGRSTVASEVRFFDAATAALVAHSYVTFMASPRPQDHTPHLARGMHMDETMGQPLPEYVEARVVAAGTAEVERAPFLEQAAGSLQGGVVALLAEMAASSLAGGAPVLDLDVRYLSAVRVGPGRATATPLGGGLARVEVRDRGRADRLTAVVFARTGTTP